MGKIKTVVMGDLETEEKARKKAEVKREQKKHTKQADEKEPEKVKERPKSVKPASPAGRSDKYSFPPGKKYAAAISFVDKTKTYSLSEALDLVKKTSYSKFDGSVELHLNVTDKGLRGTVALPHGTGKQIRVKIADDKLITELTKSGKIDFDVLVAEPAMMGKLTKVAKILGPRGLMPNPKTGTISDKPEELVKTLSSSVQWKTEPQFPIIHTVLGKVSFDPKKLEENYHALVKSIGKDKIKSAFLKATMSPSVKLQL